MKRTHKKLLVGLMAVLLLSSCASTKNVRLPKPEPWTKTEKTMAVASVVVTAADCYTTYAWDWDSYVNPLMKDKGDVIPVTIVIEAVILAVAHYLPHNWRKALLGATIGYRTAFVGANAIRKP